MAGHEQEGAQVSAQSARAAAMAIAPGVLLAGVGGGIVFPILPRVGVAAGLSLPFIGFILAANRFGRVIVNPWVGAAVDRYGGKRVLLAGLLLQTVVLGLYWVGVVSGHPGALFLIGRLVHGPASSCVFVAAQALALHAGGRDHRGPASGITRAAMQAGVPVGLIAGGVMAGVWGPAVALGSAMVAPALAAGLAAVRIPDLRAAAPDRRPTLSQVFESLRLRPVRAIAVLNGVTTFCALGVVLSSLVLIVDARHLTLFAMPEQLSSAGFMAVLVVFMMLAGLFAGRVADQPGRRTLLLMGGAVVMAPGIVLIGVAGSSVLLFSGLALVGLGMGAVTTPLLAMLGDLVAAEERGRAVGCLQLFGDLGGALGPVAGTSILSTTSLVPYLGTGALLLGAAVFAGVILSRSTSLAGSVA